VRDSATQEAYEKRGLSGGDQYFGTSQLLLRWERGGFGGDTRIMEGGGHGLSYLERRRLRKYIQKKRFDKLKDALKGSRLEGRRL